MANLILVVSWWFESPLLRKKFHHTYTHTYNMLDTLLFSNAWLYFSTVFEELTLGAVLPIEYNYKYILEHFAVCFQFNSVVLFLIFLAVFV